MAIQDRTPDDKHILPEIGLSNLIELRVFMQHHVFAVWDFMSLLKHLQHRLAPSDYPWLPPQRPEAARLINEIVLAEESDTAGKEVGAPTSHCSHFELYLLAMEEVGADRRGIDNFLDVMRRHGVREALNWARIPEPARRFMRHTFNVLTRDQPHVVAATFAAGRERLVPGMFSELLRRMEIGKPQTSVFRHYLKRHVELDGDAHGPAADLLVAELCEGDADKVAAAAEAGREAVRVRAEFLAGIQAALAEAAKAPKLTPVSWRILHSPAVPSNGWV